MVQFDWGCGNGSVSYRWKWLMRKSLRTTMLKVFAINIFSLTIDLYIAGSKKDSFVLVNKAKEKSDGSKLLCVWWMLQGRLLCHIYYRVWGLASMYVLSTFPAEKVQPRTHAELL